jgi:hypothetical protein
MKQTAVEWLINELKNTSGSYRGFNNIDITHDEIISKAKEMEKEQMVDWYATGQADTANMYEQHLKKPSNTNEK